MPAKRILHLAVDEKFIDRAYREFEIVAPGMHRYLIFGAERELKYVKDAPVEFIGHEGWQRLVQTDCAALVLHSLPRPPVLKTLPADKTVLWIGWGYDYYDLLLRKAYPAGFVLPRTRRLIHSIEPGRSFREYLVESRDSLVKSLKKQRRIARSRPYLSRIDYFAPVIETEYQQATRLNPDFTPRYIDWNYGTFEDDLSGGAEVQVGRDILVGNSATPANNHVEAFEAIARFDNLEGRKIIAPLNYGDPGYQRRVVAYGRELLGDQFVPLTGFLPLTEYLTLIGGCGFIFMNHIRQQGFANISTLLAQGARIYMNQASPLYRWLLDKGFHVSAIDGDAGDRSSAKTLETLPHGESRRNRELIMHMRGRENQRNKTRKLVEALVDG